VRARSCVCVCVTSAVYNVYNDCTQYFGFRCTQLFFTSGLAVDSVVAVILLAVSRELVTSSLVTITFVTLRSACVCVCLRVCSVCACVR